MHLLPHASLEFKISCKGSLGKNDGSLSSLTKNVAGTPPKIISII